jgi:hypothetical protein
MSEIKIKETANGGAQISQGKIFLIAQKFKIKTGTNIGQAIIVLKISALRQDPSDNKKVIFDEIKNWLLTPKQFDTWIALLMQLSNKPLS